MNIPACCLDACCSVWIRDMWVGAEAVEHRTQRPVTLARCQVRLWQWSAGSSFQMSQCCAPWCIQRCCLLPKNSSVFNWSQNLHILWKACIDLQYAEFLTFSCLSLQFLVLFCNKNDQMMALLLWWLKLWCMNEHTPPIWQIIHQIYAKKCTSSVQRLASTQLTDVSASEVITLLHHRSLIIIITVIILTTAIIVSNTVLSRQLTAGQASLRASLGVP